MKRTLALLLALLLALGGMALAEAGEKVIRFRDLEWGASYEDVRQQVELDDLEALTPPIYSTAYRMYNGEDASFETDTDFYARYASDAVDAIGKVAGYTLKRIALYFAAVPDGSGSFPGDAAHTALYMARYDVECDDWETTFESLTNKLTKLYGDVDLVGESESNPANVWYGGDGSMVSLRMYNSSELEIWYTSGDGDELRRATGEDNLDGL